MVGKTISHYQVLEKLSEGGMAVVYKVRDTRLDRFVAIKVLPSEKVADPERKRRFVQGAKAASALNHPKIITVHDIDRADGIDFFAMKNVEGKQPCKANRRGERSCARSSGSWGLSSAKRRRRSRNKKTSLPHCVRAKNTFAP